MTKRTLVFLPWLTVKQPVRIGDWQLSPLVLDAERESDLSTDSRDGLVNYGDFKAVAKVLSAYRINESYPIPCCTIVHRVGSPSLVTPLTEEQRDELAALGDVITFVALARRDFFASTSNRYCNTRGCQLYAQNFDPNGIDITAIPHYRRDGSGRIIVSYTEFREYLPSNTDRCDRWEFDEALAQAVWNTRTMNPELWEKLGDALVFFNAANRDESSAPNHSDFVQLVAAFQCFLKCGTDAAHLENEFVSLWGSPIGLAVSDLETYRPHPTTNSIVPSKSVPVRTVMGTWAREFVRMRGDLGHGNLMPLRKPTSRWLPPEHLLHASEIFPCLVLKMLAVAQLYTLTDDDQLRLDLPEARLLIPAKAKNFDGLWQTAKYWPECAQTCSMTTAKYIRSVLDTAFKTETSTTRE